MPRALSLDDDLEMIGLATDHGTERHQRVVARAAEAAALERERLQGERDLERARHAHHVDVVGGPTAQLDQLLVARGEELRARSPR